MFQKKCLLVGLGKGKVEMKKSLKGVVEISSLFAIYITSGIINEAVQQSKHAYYHISGSEHKRVCRDWMDSECLFSHLTGYYPKEFIRSKSEL